MEPLSVALGTVVLSAVAATALDQLSKAVATAHLAPERMYGWRGVGLRLIANRGLGPLSLSDRAAVALWMAVVAGTVLVLVLAPSLPGVAALGLGLSLGGATGNLIDRRVRGAVLDFIVLWRWPTFNLADAALVAGLGFVLVGVV